MINVLNETVSLSDSITFNDITAIILLVVAVINVYLSVKRNGKDNFSEYIESEKQRTEQIIKTNMKLDQICSSNNEIITSFKSMQGNVNQMHDTLINHEMRLDNAEKHIDKLENKIK